VGEVLERQDEHVVDFLMATSIVDTFNAGLAEHLTGRADAGVLLRAAEATGLFVVPLDGERRVYRYHQLFRDLLRAQLNSIDRDRALALHLQAAAWYEARGELTAAMQHLMRGGNLERAFEMLHEHVLDAWFAPASLDLAALLDELPEEAVVAERNRILDFGLGLALAGKIEAATFWLQRATQAARNGDAPDAVFEARHEIAYAVVAGLRGEAEDALTRARRAFDLVPRGVVTAIDAAPHLKLRAQFWMDDFDAARRTYNESAPGWSDLASFAVLRGAAALNECVAGNLRLATEYTESARSWAMRAGVQDHPGAADIPLTLAMLDLEHDAADDAERGFEQALRRTETVRLPYALLALLGLARVWHARGEWSQAAAAIERAREILPFGGRSPLLHHVNALEAGFALNAGDLGRAETLVATLPAGPRRALADAHYLVAARDIRAARACVDRVRPHALERRDDLEFTLVETRIAVELDEDPSVLLERALTMGRHEGFVRTLVTGDPVVAELLGDRLRRAPRDPYFEALLRALDHTGHTVVHEAASVDALSERERAVLRWLPTRLTAREIADELFISMNTLKTHLKSIYRKLDATSRAEAVTHASARGLLRL
jgi:LuxR family maltose regulon positive regulatory protein